MEKVSMNKTINDERRKIMKTFENILVVSRSTKHCRAAVEKGISLARQYGAHLFLLHVIHDPFNLDGWNLPVPSFHDEYEKMLSGARKDLDRLVKIEKDKGLPVTVWVKDGPPAEEIKKVVKDEKIDLIIMLAHEEGRLEHFLFGRTNDAILRKLPASILLVKKNG
jgi:nucleotide-binding universal stress UspA family protein